MGNVKLFCYFMYESPSWTSYLTHILTETLFKEMTEAVVAVVFGCLALKDSFQPQRVRRLLGDGVHSGLLSLVRERRNFSGARQMETLERLSALFPEDPVIVAYMVYLEPHWKAWLFDFLHAKPDLRHSFEMLLADGIYVRDDTVDWPALAQGGVGDTLAEGVTETETLDEDDEDDEAADSDSGPDVGFDQVAMLRKGAGRFDDLD